MRSGLTRAVTIATSIALILWLMYRSFPNPEETGQPEMAASPGPKAQRRTNRSTSRKHQEAVVAAPPGDQEEYRPTDADMVRLYSSIAREMNGYAVSCDVSAYITDGQVKVELDIPRPSPGYPAEQTVQVINGKVAFHSPATVSSATVKAEDIGEGVVTWEPTRVGESTDCTEFIWDSFYVEIRGRVLVEKEDLSPADRRGFVPLIVEGCDGLSLPDKDGNFLISAIPQDCTVRAIRQNNNDLSKMLIGKEEQAFMGGEPVKDLLLEPPTTAWDNAEKIQEDRCDLFPADHRQSSAMFSAVASTTEDPVYKQEALERAREYLDKALEAEAQYCRPR